MAKNIRDMPSANMPSATRRALDDFADFLDAQKATLKTNEKAAWQVADNPNLDKVDSLGEIGVIEDSGERVANALRSTPANENIIADKGLKLDNARARLIAEIDPATLNNEQRAIYDVLTGKKDRVILQGRDMSDLYELEQGSRHTAGRKIMIKHAGLEKTGGLDNRELLDMMRVVREGDTLSSSFQLYDNRLRYAYELEENGVKYRLVVDEYNDGRKVFDYYSDRNFIDDATDAKRQARAAARETKQAEAKAAKEAQGSKLTDERISAGVKQERQKTFDELSEIVGKDIKNASTDEIAVLSKKGLKKMLSDKAIQKSVENGFTAQEHINAVKSVKSLFENSKKAAAQPDAKNADAGLTIHRYNADYIDEISETKANALLTVKEYMENGKKIYSLELEELSKAKFNPSGKDLASYSSVKELSTATSQSPAKNESIIPNSSGKVNSNLNELKTALKKYHTPNNEKMAAVFERDFERIFSEAMNDPKFKAMVDGYAKALELKERSRALFRDETLPQKERKKHYAAFTRASGEAEKLENDLNAELYRFDRPDYYKAIKGESVSNLNENVNSNLNKSEPLVRDDEIIYFSSPTMGSGLLGGTLNGVEKDENGGIHFSPEKFAAGFIAGAGLYKGGQVLASKGAKAYAQKLAKQYPNIAKGNPRLMSQIASQGLKDEIGDAFIKQGGVIAKSAWGKLARLANGKSEIIGGEGAYATAPAKQGMNRAKLSQAQEMALAGKSEKEIWDKTGWYYDELDKKWKFEINPQGGRLDPYSQLQYAKEDAIILKNVIDDERLFEAYPSLRYARVTRTKRLPKGTRAATGKGDDGADYILLDSNLKKEDVKTTLYHEIQHLVQEKEGFAQGTSIEAASEYGTKQLDKLKADRAEYLSKNKKELDKIDAERKANDDAHQWETDEDYDEWFRADEALSAREKEIKKAAPRIDWNDLDAVNLYQRQGGEAEARNVEARLHSLTDNMPHPFDTLDVDRAKRVNLNGEGVSQSVKDPVQREKRGIFNVMYNDKSSTIIRKGDLARVQTALKFEKGNPDRKAANGSIQSGYGALHIEKHLDKKNEDWVTTAELLNMGEIIRKGELRGSVDKKHLYELVKDGVRFRVIIGQTGKNKKRVISFFSNRKPIID